MVLLNRPFYHLSMADKMLIHDRTSLMAHSTTDTCKNCAKCGKGFKIGTNVGYNIKINIRLGGISKISALVPMPIWLPQTKAFH